MSAAGNMKVYPSVSYKDSAKALQWLVDNFGFEIISVVYGPEGPSGKPVQHGEIQCGDTALFVGQKAPNTLTAFGMYVGVDKDSHQEFYDKLKSKGAEFTKPLYTTSYNTQEFDVMDVEGNIWSFGTYRPGVNPQNGPGGARRSVEKRLNRSGKG